MNIIFKIVVIVVVVVIWMGFSYGCLKAIVGIYGKNIDTSFTLKALKQGLTKPPKLFDFLQERANVSVTLAMLHATVNIFEDRQITIEDSKVKGIDQYALIFRNRSRVAVQELEFQCQFPQSVLNHRIISQPLTGKVMFTPAGGGDWKVSGNGEIQTIGKIGSPYYQLKIEEIPPEESVELRLDLRSHAGSHTEPFESIPNFRKEYFIAGTYSQKIGDEMVKMQTYYPIIPKGENTFSLGPSHREIPKYLLYGIGFD